MTPAKEYARFGCIAHWEPTQPELRDRGARRTLVGAERGVPDRRDRKASSGFAGATCPLLRYFPCVSFQAEIFAIELDQ